jgi:polar amino acid transport system substrate-binding protein
LGLERAFLNLREYGCEFWWGETLIKRHGVFLTFLVAFLLIIPCPKPTYCKGEIKTVRFAEEANWPPFTSDKFGIATEGLSLELMRAIFSRLGIEVEIELLPQKRMLDYLRRGAKDGATVISINKERQEYLEFSEPLFSKRGYIYYSSSRKDPLIWDDYSDLQGLTIGIVSGHNYGEDFTGAVTSYNLDIKTLSRALQGFDLLLTNRLDCFLSINLTANYLLADSKYSGRISHAPKTYYYKDYHLAFAKKSAALPLMPKVNEVIIEMKKDGSMDRIISSYLQ